MDIANEYLTTVIKRFEEYKRLGDKTFEQLNEQEMHFQPNPESNSIAVIITHMHGNMMSRWTNFLTEDGEKAWRKRDEEFEIHSFSKPQLLDLWEKGWNAFFAAVKTLNEGNLLQSITIRQQPVSVVDAINRQLAHYSYHVGQIVYIGRWIRQAGWQSLSIPKAGSPLQHK